MKPITLRLDKELIDEIDDAADEAGYASRSEYLRAVLRDHSEHDPSTARVRDEHEATTDEYDQLRSEYDERLDRLESILTDIRGDLGERVDVLEAQAADTVERVDDHETRLRSLEASQPQYAPSSGPDDASSDREEIAERLLAADWGDVMYSPTDQRVEAAAAAFAELARRGRAQTATLTEIAEEEGADVSAPNRLLSELGAILDEVEPPTRGSNRYAWTDSDSPQNT